jgi:hypothetical protein
MHLLANLVAVVHIGYFLSIVLGTLAILCGPRLGWTWVRNLPFRLLCVRGGVGGTRTNRIRGIPSTGPPETALIVPIVRNAGRVDLLLGTNVHLRMAPALPGADRCLGSSPLQRGMPGNRSLSGVGRIHPDIVIAAMM